MQEKLTHLISLIGPTDAMFEIPFWFHGITCFSMLKTDWAELLTPTSNFTSLFCWLESKWHSQWWVIWCPYLSPQGCIISDRSMPSFYPQQAARLSLCLRIPDNLGEWAYSFLFTKFGFKPYTLKILFVSALFVFIEPIEAVVHGGSERPFTKLSFPSILGSRVRNVSRMYSHSI